MKKSFIGLVVTLLILTGAYFSLKAITISSSNHQSIQSVNKTLPKETTVTLDKNGFSPAVVTIKTGSAVRWKNISGDKQTVNSDDYPTNQLHRELNFGIFNDGSSVVYTFTKPGSYGYHNQLHPEQKGKIIVTK